MNKIEEQKPTITISIAHDTHNNRFVVSDDGDEFEMAHIYYGEDMSTYNARWAARDEAEDRAAHYSHDAIVKVVNS